MLPVSLFLEMYKEVNDFKFPILDGMVPFRRLLFKFLYVRKY
jgi:hypothetical protein